VGSCCLSKKKNRTDGKRKAKKKKRSQEKNIASHRGGKVYLPYIYTSGVLSLNGTFEKGTEGEKARKREREKGEFRKRYARKKKAHSRLASPIIARGTEFYGTETPSKKGRGAHHSDYPLGRKERDSTDISEKQKKTYNPLNTTK